MSNVNFNGGLFALRWSPSLSLEGVENVEESQAGQQGWSWVAYSTKDAFFDDGPHEYSDGMYRYKFLLRRSGQRFLLAAQKQELVPMFLTHARIAVANPSIDVRRLVADLTATPDSYLLSTVYARVDAFGQSLRSLALFGADLADARLFRELLPNCTPYRVTLRDIRTHDDVTTVASRGEIGFAFKGQAVLAGIDRALAFLATGNYIKW